MSIEPGAAGAPAAGPGPTNAAQAAAALSQAQARLCGNWLHRFGAAPPHQTLFAALVSAAVHAPQRVQAVQERYYADPLALWRHLAGAAAPPSEPAGIGSDARFRAPEWRELAWFDYLRRSYALMSRWLRELVALAEVDAATRRKLEFHAQQFIDAVAPSNFLATNPEALKLAFASGGESIARGLANLSQDAARGRVSMTDEGAFEVGRDIALTPGSVVYRNELIELLQYAPRGARVHRRPLLIVPPCINRYYILDLRPENSFVRHAVENGLTVFMLSWRDVPEALSHLTWDDYVEQGVGRAIEAARAIGGDARINALGFCVGGTLLACALAVARARRRRPAASLTLLASL